MIDAPLTLTIVQQFKPAVPDRLGAHLAAVERSSGKVLALLEDAQWASAYTHAQRLHYHLRGLRAEVAR